MEENISEELRTSGLSLFTSSPVITEKDLCKLIHRAGCFPRFGQIENVSSQLDPAMWLEELRGDGAWDPDTHYLLDGVVGGFRLLDEGAAIRPYMCENYKSCYGKKVKDTLNNLIDNEISQGKLSVVPERPICIHSLGAVMKDDQSVRPITDCKRPLETSVNSFTSEVFSTFEFVKFDDILESVKCNTYMATVDIKAAYRSVMIHPSNRKYFGLKWLVQGKEQYLVDNFICFGAKVAPGCFSRVTDAVGRMMKRRGFSCFSYLDDFLCLGSSERESRSCQIELIKLLRKLGFYINWKKVASPNKKCRYLGIVIDSELMELSLPPKKLNKLVSALNRWVDAETISKIELQKLLGLLGHGAKVMKGGRLYLGRLNELLATMPEDREMKIPMEAREDVKWWLQVVGRLELRVKIVPEFQWVHVAVLRWGDIATRYKNDHFRFAYGIELGVGIITWGETLNAQREDDVIRISLPSEIRNQPSVIELVLMIECVKLLKLKVNLRFCFTIRAAYKQFRSGISEVYWLRDYLKVFFWMSVFDQFEISSVYVSHHSNRSVGHTGGRSQRGSVRR